MRDWLTIQIVFGALLVASFTCVGLLALWAATSPRHWFVRIVIVLGALSPLLLRPMYEPFITFTTQLGVIATGTCIYLRRAVLWEIARGRRRIVLPRFSIQSLLSATCLIAIATAVAVAATKRLGSTFWITPAPLGVVAGLTTLLAAWLARVDWSWKTLSILLIVLVPLSYAYEEADYLRELAPVVNFWPHRWPGSSVFPAVVNYLRALAHATSAVALQYVFLLTWRRWLSPVSGSHIPRAPHRLLIAATMLLLAAFPVYMVAKLQFPSAIPEKASFSGDDARFQELLALATSFKSTALWRELCADPVNEQRVAQEAKQQAHQFGELHRILERPFLRPVTVEWIAGEAEGWRNEMEKNSQLSVLASIGGAIGRGASRRRYRNSDGKRARSITGRGINKPCYRFFHASSS